MSKIIISLGDSDSSMSDENVNAIIKSGDKTKISNKENFETGRAFQKALSIPLVDLNDNIKRKNENALKSRKKTSQIAANSNCRKSRRLNTKSKLAEFANMSASLIPFKGLLVSEYSQNTPDLSIGIGHAVFFIPKLRRLYNFSDYRRGDGSFKQDGFSLSKYIPPSMERPLASRRRALEEDDPTGVGMCALVSKAMSFLYYSHFGKDILAFEDFLLCDSTMSKDVVRLAICGGMQGVATI